jgi:glucan phosphoethanolaminetransferase (alkaline phosphatase superfamily)
MNAQLILILMYVWIGFIHAVFTGVTVLALLPKHAAKWPAAFIILLLIAIQAFLETYWIPVAHYLGLQLTSDNAQINEFFQSTTNRNIVNALHPGWLSPLLWAFWGIVAWLTGRKIMSRFTFKQTQQ